MPLTKRYKLFAGQFILDNNGFTLDEWEAEINHNPSHSLADRQYLLRRLELKRQYEFRFKTGDCQFEEKEAG